MLHVPTLFISVLFSWTYKIKGLSIYMLILNITFPTYILWSVKAVHTPSLARHSVLTQQHVWLFDLYLCSSSCTYHCLFDDWCACSCLDGISFVCLCYNLIRVSCLFPSPFVPFQLSIMNRLLRVRPSQKLVYENLPVQTKIINGRSRMKFYLKHHWGGGKASVGFDLDLIRTLV